MTDKLIIGLIWLLSVVLIAFSKEPAYLHPGELEYPHLHLNEIVYSINRGLLAIFVLYYLHPRYFALRKYALFALFTVLSFATFCIIEDSLIKPFFFADTLKPPKSSSHWESSFPWDASILLALMFLVKLAWEYREQTQQRLASIEREKISSELKFLRSQINPHMLFNILNNIYSHTLTNTGAAPQLLLQLSDLLRYTIYECSEEAVEVERELQALNNYVELQKAGLESRADVTVNVTGDVSDKLIPPHILITLVENCFKHSQNTQEEGISIRIDIDVSEDGITMKTQNSFSPIARGGESTIREKGVGIANVQRRLELLFQNEFELETNEESDTFYLCLKLPVETRAAAQSIGKAHV